MVSRYQSIILPTQSGSERGYLTTRNHCNPVLLSDGISSTVIPSSGNDNFGYGLLEWYGVDPDSGKGICW